MSESTKTCRKCSQVKPHAAFHRVKANRDGLRSTCRTCWSEYHKSYYEANRDRVREQRAERRARDPEGLKSRERERAARRRAADPERTRELARRWRAANRERAREVSRNHYARHRDRRQAEAREYQRLWRQANRDLAVIKDSNKRLRRRSAIATALVIPFTARQLADRISMWPGCWMCGGPKQSVDHVKPIARGGPHCLSNLRPACRTCNASKSDRWPFRRAA